MSNRRKRCATCHTHSSNSKRRCTNCSSDFTNTSRTNRNTNRIFLGEIRNAGVTGPVSDTLRLSIQNGADINTLSNTVNPRTGLMQAAAVGNHHIVHFLIGLIGININKQTAFGSTALSIAASGGHRACLALLLTSPGIDINHQDVHGGTALMAATRPGNHWIVRRLLQFPGINANIQDEHGRTALFFAAGLYAQQTITTMVQWYLGQVALGLNQLLDVNIQSSDGSTALMRAVAYNKRRNVLALLQVRELNIVSVNNAGNTALTIPLLERGAQDVLRSWHRRMTTRLRQWHYTTRRKRRRREKGLTGYVSRKRNQPLDIERHQKGFLQHSLIKLRF